MGFLFHRPCDLNQRFLLCYREPSETSSMCDRCIQQDVKLQEMSKTLTHQCNILSKKRDRQFQEILKLRAEVRILRKWAKLQKLSPPSPPATPPPKTEQSIPSIDPNYEYCMEKEGPSQQRKQNGEKTKKDRVNFSDVIQTHTNTPETLVEVVKIKEEVKGKRNSFAHITTQITELYSHIFRERSWSNNHKKQQSGRFQT